jgi:hypothetical protein
VATLVTAVAAVAAAAQQRRRRCRQQQQQELQERRQQRRRRRRWRRRRQQQQQQKQQNSKVCVCALDISASGKIQHFDIRTIHSKKSGYLRAFWDPWKLGEVEYTLLKFMALLHFVKRDTLHKATFD